MWRFIPGFFPGLWRVVIIFHLNLVALHSFLLSWLVVVFSSWWRVVVIFHLNLVALQSCFLSWLVARSHHFPSKSCGALFLASFLACGRLSSFSISILWRFILGLWRVVIIFHLNLVALHSWPLSWLVARCHQFPSKSCGASFLASFLVCNALSSFSI